MAAVPKQVPRVLRVHEAAGEGLRLLEEQLEGGVRHAAPQHGLGLDREWCEPLGLLLLLMVLQPGLGRCNQ